MIDYFDASAVAAMLLNERSSQGVVSVMNETDRDVVVSAFCIAEVSSAISRLLRMKSHSREQAERLLSLLDRWTDVVSELTEIESADFSRATELVRTFDLKLRAPDALHLAVVERLDARLITLDRNLATAARAVGVETHNPAEAEAPGEPKD
ncbi:MAG: type II toxin-antitoxin system VapC family toxin [Alphaproteobacteria bacterium]|nr:type II toxin-antitoxin system VapC family toxin [Alphaproteobacteria bacterium]MBU2378178.1 type II toxin-antitoxin system VapC family toxin [Alphaproteobacteria bacterium]